MISADWPANLIATMLTFHLTDDYLDKDRATFAIKSRPGAQGR